MRSVLCFPKGKPVPAQPKAVSIIDASKIVGVSTDTIRRRISDGTLKAFRVGRVIRIPVSELDKLMRRSIPTAG